MHDLLHRVFQGQFFYSRFEATVLEFNLAYHWRAHPQYRCRSINGYVRVRFGLSSDSTEISMDLFNTLATGSRLKFKRACFVEV